RRTSTSAWRWPQLRVRPWFLLEGLALQVGDAARQRIAGGRHEARDRAVRTFGPRACRGHEVGKEEVRRSVAVVDADVASELLGAGAVGESLRRCVSRERRVVVVGVYGEPDARVHLHVVLELAV